MQEVSGLHSGVNPVSGDFSTGAEGLRIRNGEVAEPVREFTIASTLQRMLHDVQAVGNDLAVPAHERGRGQSGRRRRHHLRLVSVAPAPVVDPPDDESADLLAVATRVADQAGADEQVEAFVGRSSYTTVRVHGGEVESFTAASQRGHRRQGRA